MHDWFDQISEEIWREINRFHLLIKSSHNDRHWHKNPIDFYRKVIDLCMLLSGLINSTILHDEGWNFLKQGNTSNVPNKTLRILTLFSDQGENSRSITSTLRSATAYSAYLSANERQLQNRIHLPLSPLRPILSKIRSILLPTTQFFLHQISGCPISAYSNSVEEITRNIVAKLDFYNTQTSDKNQLKGFLDPLLEELNTIGIQLFDENNYAMPKFQEPFNVETLQQTQQYSINRIAYITMRLKIYHQTKYQYATTVEQNENELRLTPKTNRQQYVESSFVYTYPAIKIQRYDDLNFNRVHRFFIPHPHQELTIESRSIVQTQQTINYEQLPYGFAHDQLKSVWGLEETHSYLQNSTFVDVNPDIWKEAIQIKGQSNDVFQTTYAIMEFIYENYTTPLAQHLCYTQIKSSKSEKVSCQD